ncbi:MAG: hypothetical protein M3O29_07430, partial [Actinomycetota bacterium]|nr:hypothetical protein [Actinomycetota bacterium]
SQIIEQRSHAFDDCARVGCSIRLLIGRSRQVLAFENAEQQREFPIDMIGHSPNSPIDATVRCEAPKEVATALRYRHSPKYW